MYQAKKRLIAVLSLLAFLMNVVLPYYAVSSITTALNQSGIDVSKQSVQRDSLASLLGDKILICTSTGYKWVSVAEFFGGDTDNEPSHNSLECPLCYIAKDSSQDIVTGSLAIVVSDELDLAVAAPLYSSVYSNHKTYLFLSGGFTRAPPQYFV